MYTRKISKTLLTSSIALAVSSFTFAQGDSESRASSKSGLNLEELVVTGTPRGISKMESSLSVTTVSSERIESFVPRGTMDILKSIPGIRVESTGGDSNGNINVRGVPLGGGGSKFIQLHEDGLPVMQFGDIIVGNSDNYFTYDQSVASVQAVKGGTAATLASNAPSGIINFVSKTGEEEGGILIYTTGLDYDSNRVDFAYGAPVGDDWTFHVGGFYRVGEGVRPTGFNADKGGQIKLTVTKDFENGEGKMYFKSLNDQTATILPMPMTLDNGALPGLDPRFASNIPAALVSNQSNDGNGGIRESNVQDGNKAESTVIGGTFTFDFENGLRVTEKFRYAQNSGKFFGTFSAGVGAATDPFSVLGANGGSFVNASTEDALVTNADTLTLGYANGPDSGRPLTDQELADLNGNGMIQDLRNFDNDINNLDNFTNDLSISKNFDVGDGSVDVTLGYHTASQDLDIDWYWQSHIVDVQNEPRLLDLYSGATRLTSNGQVAFGAPQWGNCCTRDTVLQADIDAVYLAVAWDVNDALNITASVRQDDGDASGSWITGSVAPRDLDADGIISFAEANAEAITTTDRANSGSNFFTYNWRATSFALGVNYILNDSLAVFGNYSEGNRANFDRLADGGYISNGEATPNSVVNELTMLEAGVKWESDHFGVFATLFRVETDDSNSEAGRGFNGVALVREFESNGLEVEFTADFDNISFFGGLTYTDAEIAGANDPSVVGNVPRRQPDLIYTGTADYSFGAHSVGLSMFGRSDSFVGDDNSNELHGYTTFNVYANVQIAESLVARLSINNLTDEIGITEAEGGFQTVNGFDVIRGRSILGRSSTLELRYQF